MIANTLFVLSFICLCWYPVLSTTARTSNDDIDIVRQRVLELIIWPSAENISETIADALSYNSTLNSSCYWPDINYHDQGMVVWLTSFHMRRVTTMLQAITVNGSRIQNDPSIMKNVHCALNVWLINDWQNPNWWANQIYIPLQATGQLLMLGDNATSFEIEKIKEISYRACWWLPSPYYVGTNLVWMIQVELYRSLATRNTTGVEQGFSRMWQDVIISNTSQDGIQVDWTYHFHNKIILSGSYGRDWANNILLFTQCSFNTSYEIDDRTLSLFTDFLIKGDAWMIPTSEWDYSVIGRFIAEPGNGFGHNLETDWIRTVAQLVKSNETRTELKNLANRIDNLPNVPSLVGNRHFFGSDYQVHRRTNWTSSIKMQSWRTLPTECLLHENLKGEHLGQGVLNLYRTGFNDYSDIFPLIDWQAINGITVEHSIPLEPCDGVRFSWLRTSFVGGVSDGQYGLAMMDTASHNLTAQRSWHFYDDAIVALATNLTLRTPTTAWTTLASRVLSTGQISIGFFNSTVITFNDGNYSFPYVQNQTSNVQWIHVGDSNICYVLQLQQQYDSVGVEVGVKSGNYSEISPFKQTVTARILTLYINHGVGPYTLDYNYMLLPNVSLESVPTLIKKYDEEQVFACISTNHTFHGTMWPTLRRAAFVVWSYHLTTFSCLSPTFNLNITLANVGAFLFSETDEDFTLTASYPERLTGYLNVTVGRVGYGEGCSVSSDVDATKTKVSLMLPTTPELIGMSVNVTCKK